jgi:hypothetical protein
MKTLWFGIFGGVVLCGVALAQGASAAQKSGAQNAASSPSAQVSSGQANETFRIAPGSVIPVLLSKTIDAKKAKTGDEVEAKVTQDLKTDDGEVIVAKDTKVLGHVTAVQARNKEQKESQVGITFDHAFMKNGTNLALPMSIQAIIAAPTATSGPGNGDNENGGSAPSAGGTAPGGRAMGGAAPPPMRGTATPGGSPDNTSSGANAHQPITGNTQGVLGIADLHLSAAQDSTGSLLSSQKSNVKIESGTLMLLRVNQ